MNKRAILVSLFILVLILAGCDQTFILYRGKNYPVQSDRSVKEVWVEIQGHDSNGNFQGDTENFQGNVENPDLKNKINGDVEEPDLKNKISGDVEVTSSAVVDDQNQDRRQIEFNITADFPAGVISPDSIMLDDKIVDSKAFADMGEHRYTIKKAGYFNLEGDIPAGRDYAVSARMEAKPRIIRLNITDQKSGAMITPTKVVIGAQVIQDGVTQVKPSDQPLRIVAKGYKTLMESSILINAGNGAFTLSRTLIPVVTKIVKIRASKIILELAITGDYPADEEISPENVTIDGKDGQTGDVISAGAHNVVIEDPAYEIYRNKIFVPEGIPTYELKAKLVTLPRKINISIRYDVYPSQEQAEKLGNCEVGLYKIETGETFPITNGIKVKPGTYELLLKRLAYTDIRKKIRIWPSSSVYKIDEEMKAKLRVVKAQVDYDIEPPAELPDNVIDFIDLDTNVRRTIKPNGTIKPGKYKYEVSKPGYKMIGGQRKITIEPEETIFNISAKLEASPRQISFETLNQGVAVTPSRVKISGKRYSFDQHYRPGRYHIVVEFQNYQTIEKDITVSPGVGPFVVKGLSVLAK